MNIQNLSLATKEHLIELITGLNKSVEELTKANEKLTRQIFELTEENKKLRERLKILEADLARQKKSRPSLR